MNMEVKNYSYAAFIKKTIPLFLMMLFVNVGWGQYNGVGTFNKITSLTDLTDGYYVIVNSGDGFAMNNTNAGKFFTNTAITATSGVLTNPVAAIVWKIENNGLGRTIYNEGSQKYVSYTGGSNECYAVSTATTDNQKWKITYSSSTFMFQNLAVTTRSLKYNSAFPRFACYTSTQQDLLLYKLAPPPNLVPTVSNVSIIGLPNTTVELTGSYDYADTENDVDASTYKWYTATDASGTGAVAIAGASGINYTLTASELEKYIRFGVTAAAATGTSPGTEAFSSWIGPVNAAGSPVLNAGLLADFAPTCLNATSEANSFTLMGNNLNSNVTIGALSGFTYAATEGSAYTTTLTISPVSEQINTTIYVKFTPTLAQSYDGNITISGGGASSVDVSVVASGINSPVSVTTGTSDALAANGATINGSLVEGCSVLSAYGMEYSTTSGFANGAGTSLASANLNAGNFTVNLSGLQSNTTYYYKAFATDATGTVYGTQSSFTTEAISDPTAAAATAVTQTGFTANWNAVAGASGYELDVYEGSITNISSTETFTEIGGGTTSSYSTRTWTGEGGISWTGFKSRTDQVVASANDAITLKNEAGSFLESGSIIGKLKFISMDFKQVFTGSGGALTLKILYGADFAQSITIGAYSYNETASTINALITPNIDGPFKIVLENNTSARVAIDNLKIDREESNITYALINEPTGNVTTFSIENLTPNTDYFYRVRAKDATSTSVNSNEIAVTTLDDKTTYTAGAWTNGDPTVNLDAIIADNFTSGTNFTAKSLTINAGSVFTVGSGSTVTVANALVNNAGASGLVVESDGVILQTSDIANTNALATVKRNSTSLFRQDYTLWSSPVAGQNLRAFSPNTIFSRFYSYDYPTVAPEGSYKQELETSQDIATKNFAAGTGYLIRMPNVLVPASTTYIDFTSELIFNGAFTGNLNNGTVSVPLYGNVAGTSSGLTLVGNPYPAPIKISTFLDGNLQITNTLYFWRKKGSNTDTSNSKSGYATLSGAGMVSAEPALNGQLLTHIKAGQGFFVKTNAATPANLVFTNIMRESASTFFFKSADENPNELHRFWLNLASDTNTVGQTLVAYATDATLGVDHKYDAAYFNDSPVALTSIINNDEYIIQGRGLPFTTNDVVSLGFKTDNAGSFTISLADFDGLFVGEQGIFLKDNATNILHNLKANAYTFTTQVGVFNNRFEVHYNTTLSTSNPTLDANTILVGVKNQQIKINAGSVTMNRIELIDVTGRVIYTADGVNATTATIDNLPVLNQMLIVRIKTSENVVVSQKIIF